jgi:hypothetical protein
MGMFFAKRRILLAGILGDKGVIDWGKCPEGVWYEKN